MNFNNHLIDCFNSLISSFFILCSISYLCSSISLLISLFILIPQKLISLHFDFIQIFYRKVPIWVECHTCDELFGVTPLKLQLRRTFLRLRHLQKVYTKEFFSINSSTDKKMIFKSFASTSEVFKHPKYSLSKVNCSQGLPVLSRAIQ